MGRPLRASGGQEIVLQNLEQRQLSSSRNLLLWKADTLLASKYPSSSSLEAHTTWFADDMDLSDMRLRLRPRTLMVRFPDVEELRSLLKLTLVRICRLSKSSSPDFLVSKLLVTLIFNAIWLNERSDLG